MVYVDANGAIQRDSPRTYRKWMRVARSEEVSSETHSRLNALLCFVVVAVAAGFRHRNVSGRSPRRSRH